MHESTGEIGMCRRRSETWMHATRTRDPWVGRSPRIAPMWRRATRISRMCHRAGRITWVRHSAACVARMGHRSAWARTERRLALQPAIVERLRPMHRDVPTQLGIVAIAA